MRYKEQRESQEEGDSARDVFESFEKILARQGNEMIEKAIVSAHSSDELMRATVNACDDWQRCGSCTSTRRNHHFVWTCVLKRFSTRPNL